MEIRDTSFLVDAVKKGIEKDHTQYCWFLGAGCSISSGIPSGWRVIDIVQKMFYDQQQKQLFADWQQQPQISYSQYDHQFQQEYLSDEQDRNKFQAFLKEKQQSLIAEIEDFTEDDKRMILPAGTGAELFDSIKQKVIDDYAYGYWLKLFGDEKKIQILIEKIIGGNGPRLAYVIFAHLISKGYIHNVFTTNFDDLVNEALRVYFHKYVRVTAHPELSNYIDFNSIPPNIIKIHGDPWFNNLRNTAEEVNRLQNKLSERLKEGLSSGYGLIVAGYNGADYAVLNVLESAKTTIYPLIWCDLKPFEELHWRVNRLLTTTNNNFYIQIQSFEDMMAIVEQQLALDRMDILDEQMNRQIVLNNLYSEATILSRLSESTRDYLNDQYNQNSLYGHAVNEKDFEQSNIILQQLMSLSPRHSKAHLRWAFNLTEQYKISKDKALLEKALDVYKICLEIIGEGRKQEAAEAYSNMSFCLIELYRGKGTVQLLEECIRLLQTAIGLYPDDNIFYANIGYCYQLLWDADRKKEYIDSYTKYYELALQKDPHNYNVYHNWSWSFITLYKLDNNKDHLEKAIEKEKHVVRINPVYAPSHYNLAYCNNELFEFDDKRNYLEQSIIDCDKVIEIDPLYFKAIHLKINTCQKIWDTFKDEAMLQQVHEIIKENSRKHKISFTSELGWYYIKQWEITKNKKFLSQANTQLIQAIKERNNKVDHYNLGLCFFDLWEAGKKKKDLDKALQYYKKAIALEPNLHKAYSGLGNLYLSLWNKNHQLVDLKRAHKYNSKAIELNPKKDTLYHFNFSQVLRQYWKYYHRREFFDQALEQLWQAYSLGNRKLNTLINLYINLMELFSMTGEDKVIYEAIDLLKKHAIDFPRDLNFGLGECYDALYRIHSDTALLHLAASAYERAIEADPSYYEAFDNNGSCYLNLGIHTKNPELLLKAVEQFKKALVIKPDIDLAYYNWGLACMHLTEFTENKEYYDEAIAKFRKTTDINNRYKQAFFFWGFILQNQWEISHENKKLEEAIVKFKEVIAIDKKYVDAYFQWGWCLFKLYEYNGMIDYLKNANEKFGKAIHIDPSHLLSLYFLGDSLQTIGHTTSNAKYLRLSITKFKNIIENNPDETDAWYKSAYSHVILFQLFGDQQALMEAIDKFKKVIELDQSYADAYLKWGWCLQEIYLLTNDPAWLDEAIAVYQKAIQINPSNDLVYYNLGITSYLKAKITNDLKFIIDGCNFLRKTITINNKYTDAYLQLHNFLEILYAQFRTIELHTESNWAYRRYIGLAGGQL